MSPKHISEQRKQRKLTKAHLWTKKTKKTHQSTFLDKENSRKQRIYFWTKESHQSTFLDKEKSPKHISGQRKQSKLTKAYFWTKKTKKTDQSTFLDKENKEN